MGRVSSHRLSFLLVCAFLAGVTLLFAFLTSRPPRPKEETEAITQSQPEVTVINPQRGAQNASVTIVEYADFECQACRDLAITLDVIAKEYPKDVRVVWKDFPNADLHPESVQAALAARCAADQGAFWLYHDLLFTQSNFLSENTYRAIAQTLKLDEDAFASCLSKKEPLARIDHDFQEGLRLGITATPTIFIGSDRYVGALSEEAIRELIEPYLR